MDDFQSRNQKKWRCPDCGTLHVFPAPPEVGYKLCCISRAMEYHSSNALRASEDEDPLDSEVDME